MIASGQILGLFRNVNPQMLRSNTLMFVGLPSGLGIGGSNGLNLVDLPCRLGKAKVDLSF